MNIVLQPEVLKAYVKAGLKSAKSHILYSAHRPLQLDLQETSVGDLKLLRKVMRQQGDEKSRTALKILKLYISMDAHRGSGPIRRLKQLVEVLKNHIKESPLGKKGKFIIMTQEDDEVNLWLPYVCTSIEYHPPKKTRYGSYPPYVSVHGSYYQDGSVEMKTWRFDNNIEGKTINKIVQESSFVVSTQELAEAYERDTDRYREMRPKIGLQCLASGSVSVSDGWWGSNKVAMEVDGVKTPVLIDIDESNESNKKNETPRVSGAFWYDKVDDQLDDPDDIKNSHEGDEELEEGEKELPTLEAPLHPYLTIFDLKRHTHADIHIRYLDKYIYNPSLGKSLVLPSDNRELIEALVKTSQKGFEDIVSGKSGGTIVLCSGSPGTGKTLTAEVFSEVIEKPLYSVQSSQLGTSADELETELKKVLIRAMRWKAILLIDEADVFIHERGEDIEQNAIVGIFLRVLEYYSGVLFLTTNRATITDDAIASRCTAHVTYDKPSTSDRLKIWNILAKKAGIKVSSSVLGQANKHFKELSGRDVKNLLKLSSFIAVHRKKPLSFEIIKFAHKYSITGVEEPKS